MKKNSILYLGALLVMGHAIAMDVGEPKAPRTIRDYLNAREENFRQQGLGKELRSAAADGNLNKVTKIVESGFPIDDINKTGNTAFMEAARYGRIDICSYLLEKHANINHQDYNGETALMWAAQFAYVYVCEFLLNNGAEIDLQDYQGNTALMAACAKNRLEAATLLIDKGANIDHANKRGITILMTVANQGSVPMVQLLIEKGAQVNLKIKNITALIDAGNHKKEAVCKILINAMVKLTKEQKDSAQALLASLNKKHPRAKDTNKLITKDLISSYKQLNKQKVIEQIHKIVHTNIKGNLLLYLEQI